MQCRRRDLQNVEDLLRINAVNAAGVPQLLRTYLGECWLPLRSVINLMSFASECALAIFGS